MKNLPDEINLYCEREKLSLKIQIDKENEDIVWHCSNKRVREWPKHFREQYAVALLEVSKRSKKMPDIVKLRHYLMAYSAISKRPGHTEITRGLSKHLNERQIKLVMSLMVDAEEYFGIELPKEELLPEAYEEVEQKEQLSLF